MEPVASPQARQHNEAGKDLQHKTLGGGQRVVRQSTMTRYAGKDERDAQDTQANQWENPLIAPEAQRSHEAESEQRQEESKRCQLDEVMRRNKSERRFGQHSPEGN